MSETFKDRITFDKGSVKIAITPRKKGTLIYLDERPTMKMNLIQSVNNEEEINEEKAFLVFDVPFEMNVNEFDELLHQEWLGLEICYYAGWTEISCLYPHCLDSNLLNILKENKIIRMSMKEYPSEKGKYPQFIDAKGFQIVYNMFSIFKEMVRNTKFNLSKRKKDDLIDQSDSQQ